MRATHWIFWLSFCIATLAAMPAAPTRAAAFALSIPVQPRAGDVQTDGTFVVWTDLEGPQYDAPRHLYAAALSDGQPQMIAANVPASDERGPNIGISDGVVIWQEGSGLERAIWAKNLRTGQRFMIVTGEIAYPAISGSIVTWWEDFRIRDSETARKPATLKARNIATMSAPVTLSQTDKTPYGFGPSKMSEGWIAYAKATSAAKVAPCWQLEVAPIAGGSPNVIGDLGCTPPKFDIIGGRLTYINRDGLLIVNVLLGGGERLSGPHGAQSLTSDLRYSFWSKRRDLSQSEYTYDLWGYDVSTESAFLVAPGTMIGSGSRFVPVPNPHTRGDVLAWIAGEADGSVRLRAARIVDLLPNAKRDGTGAGQIWFPEVGHTLGGSFRSFWERNGGLPVFGFPLTEEFIQKSRDTGQGYPVQYLERQRYEYHAENAGTAYEVLLGRLGAEQLEWLGRDWQREPKASPRAAHYYAVTGHAIAPEFWSYWRSHGLELGDRGLSERENLALFGFPLTEPQMETNSSGDRVLTQWFERARFEYHPNNPADSRVLLGRLSADILDRHFWN